MPLYTITMQTESLTSESRARLASQITELHSKYAGVPRNWVHIIFQQYERDSGFTAGAPAKAVALTLMIRTGRSDEYKRGLLTQLWKLLQTATGAPDDQMVVGILEVSANQAMEMGEVMPSVDQIDARA